MATHHIKVKGKVQGVFYRATAKKVALASGLAGWVKNTVDEEVEIMVTGEDKALEAFAVWCKSGPPKAEVTEVIVTSVEEIQFDDFKIER